MSRKAQFVSVKPDVLEWVRQSSGLTPEEASTRLSVSVSSVLRWENGERRPTFKQVQKMAKVYKRPSAAFFLPKPAKEPELPPDFRRLFGEPREFTSKTLLAIRKARYLQAISSDLMVNLDHETDVDARGANIKINPELVADAERDRTGISTEKQKAWKSFSEALNKWRQYVEERNINVFQFSMELDELRGLTLMDATPFAIVLNSSDLIQARIFTLLHEYGHILLHEPALCTPVDPTTKGHGQHFETWCNRFAAAFLIPSESVKEDCSELGPSAFERIAKQYKVSSFALLSRLVELELISRLEYEQRVTELRHRSVDKRRSGGGGESSAQRARRERGEGFVSLVLKNSEREHITYSDALDYLDIKTKHMKELTSPM
jgi:Zn-dependent peptidase ImmA (M78 family)